MQNVPCVKFKVVTRIGCDGSSMVKNNNNDNSGKSKKSAQTPPELSSLKIFHQATIFLTTPFFFHMVHFAGDHTFFTAKLFLSVYYFFL